MGAIELIVRRLAGDGLINLRRARAEVLSVLACDGQVLDAPTIADEVDPRSIPSSAACGLGDRVLAEIDHDGFAFAQLPQDERFFNRRAEKHPRQQHGLDIVLHRRRVCVRKQFRPPRWDARQWGDRRISLRAWVHRSLWVHLKLLFYNEAAALLRLRALPFVPKLRGFDVGRQVLFIDYVAAESLRHVAARAGAPVHDLELPQDPSLSRLSSRELDRREVDLLNQQGGDYRREIAGMAREINRCGVAPLDIKLGNFLRGTISGRLYWIDFELARLASQPRWDADLQRQDEILRDLFDLDCGQGDS